MASIIGWVGASVVAAVLAAGDSESARIQALEQRAEQLEREARALVETSGCKTKEQCALAPLGHKSCGGPRTFVPYCTLTTDKGKLDVKLKELEEAERAWQEAAHIMSTCSLQRRPVLEWVDGECRAR